MRFAVFLIFVQAVSCLDFRCHCNSQHCVATGYLCKSDLGCYVERELFEPDYHAFESEYNFHFPSVMAGCIEDLPGDKSFKCWADDVWDVLRDPSKIRIRHSDSEEYLKNYRHSSQYLDSDFSEFLPTLSPDPKNNLISNVLYSPDSSLVPKRSVGAPKRALSSRGRRRRNGPTTNVKKVGGSAFECCFKDLCNLGLVFGLYEKAVEKFKSLQEIRGFCHPIHAIYLSIISVIIIAMIVVLSLNVFLRRHRRRTVAVGDCPLVADDQNNVDLDEENDFLAKSWRLFKGSKRVDDHGAGIQPRPDRDEKSAKKSLLFASLAHNSHMGRTGPKFSSNCRRV